MSLQKCANFSDCGPISACATDTCIQPEYPVLFSMFSGVICLRLKPYLVVKIASDVLTVHCCQVCVLAMMLYFDSNFSEICEWWCMMTSSNGNIFRVTGRRRGDFIYPLICAWTKGWVNNRDAGDLKLHRDHYDVTVMGSDHCTAYNSIISI